jgi:hypothetical protein
MTALSDRPSGAGINRNALYASAALIGVGGLLCAVGAAVIAATAVGALRRWVDHLDEPPSQTARRRLSQAKAAASVGLEAWRHEARPTAVTNCA